MVTLNLNPCLSPVWAPTGHAQTWLGYFLPSPVLQTQGTRIEITLPDQDRMVAQTYAGTSDLVIYLFHGLGGNTTAGYMQRTARLCQEADHTVWLVNHRGCGEGFGIASQPYHSGRAEDLSAAIEVGKKRFPNKRHLAIGFSLSGNALLLLMTGRRGQVKPDYAISVNAPIELAATALKLSQGLNRIYDFWFVQHCRWHLVQKKRHGLLDRHYEVPIFSRLTDFDDIYTAPAGGFADAKDYYISCSAQAHLSLIDQPTLMISAKDDPIIPYRDYLQAKLSPFVQLHIENHGGHLGYISREKTPLVNNRWLDYALKNAVAGFYRLDKDSKLG